jgi:hypothetical protein
MLQEQDECQISKGERKQDKKGATTPEGETEQEPARQHEVRPVNLEPRQRVRKYCVGGQYKGNRQQAKRDREIAEQFADGDRGCEFLDHELVTIYQIHGVSTSTGAHRLGPIRPIRLF